MTVLNLSPVMLTRRDFMIVRQAYIDARWNWGMRTVERTGKCIDILQDVITFYRSASDQEEKQRRSQFFGLSVNELESAIKYAIEYRDGLIEQGGTRGHFAKVGRILMDIKKSKDYLDLSKEARRGLRRR